MLLLTSDRIKMVDQKLKRKKLWITTALVLYFILIWVLSSIPRTPSIVSFYGVDKIAHIFLYAGLGALIFLFFRTQKPSEKFYILLLLTVLSGTFYGAVDELHQRYVPGRTSSIYDLVADAIGTFFGAILIHKILGGRF